MAINFPNSPIVGQTYTFNEKTWQWSGSYWEVFSAQTGYVQGAINVGGGEEIFKEKSGNDLYFRTLSGGSNTTISTVGDLVKVDVTIPADTNTFVTGFTYNDANTFTIGQNDGSNFSATINTMTGLTVNGGIDTTTLTGVSAYFSSDINVRGQVNYAKNATDPLVDIGEMAAYLHPMGRTQGGNISKTYPSGTGTSGRTITISDTVGFTMLAVSPTTHAITELNITGGDYVIAANSDLYVYYDRYGVFQTAASLPSNRTNIILGRVITDSDSILYIENSRLNAHHMSNYQDTMFREAIGAIVSSGGFITENTSNPLQLDITNCTYFYSTSELELDAATGITFNRYYRDTGEPFFYKRLSAATPSVIDGLYDTGANSLTGVTDGYYKKDLLMGIETRDGEQLYLLIYADSIHPNQTDAELAPLPPPPSFAVNTFIRLASIVSTTSGGTTTISSILDERPRIGFTTSAVSQLNINDHSQLSNLGADDHLQYLRTDGGRVMTGPLDLGVNDIENVDNLTVINNTTLSGLTTVYGDTPTSPAIQPGVNNTYSLGAPSFRWNEIYTTNLDATNVITTFSLFATNNVTVDNNLVVSGDSRLIGSSTYESNVTGSNPKEIVNVEYLTAYTESNDTYVTGGTVSVSATDSNNSGTIGLFYKNSDGTPRTLPFEDTFTTGATYDNGTALATFTKNDGNTYTLDLSTIDVNDTFSTGGTVTQSSSNNENNQTIQIVGNAGFVSYNITNVTDTFTTGGTYNNSTSLITFDKNDGTSYNVDLSSIDVNDTFVTGFTYNDANTFTISRNDGVNISTSINIVTGLTVNGDIEMGNSSTRQIYSTGVSEISSIQYTTSGTSVQMRWDGGGDSTVFNVNNTDFTSISSTKSGFGGISYGADYSANYNDRSLIDLGYFNSNNRYVTGGTYDNNTALISYSGANGFPSFTVDLSSIDVNDTFVTGSTVTSNVLELTRNDSQKVLQLSGGTNLQFIDNGNNSITINATSGGGGGASVSFPWKFKDPTASADPGSGQFRLNNTIPSGITEIYVNNFTNNGIDASNLLNILDVGDVIYIQQNDDATRAVLFTVSASTVDNTGWFTIPVQYQQGSQIPKKDKICGWIFASTGAEDNTVSNIGAGQGVFKQRNGNDFEFYSLSGGGSTTISVVNDTIIIGTAIPPSMNTYVTGGTYNDVTDTITLTRNDAVTIDITGVTDTFTTGATYDNGTALATFTRNDGNTYTLDLSSIDVNDTFSTGGTVTQSSSNNNPNQTIQIVGNDGFSSYNITGITDTFTTGGTYNNGTALITFDKNDGTSYNVDLSSLDLNDTFVTGFTYNNNNTFTISRNDGVNINTSINIVSGLTVNGDLTVTGETSLQSTTASTLTLSLTPTENNTNTEILSRNSSTGVVEYRDIATFGVNITTVTATTYTATTTDDVIGFDTTSVSPTLFLPDSTTIGRIRYEVKDIGVNSRRNPITIQAAGSDTIITTSVVSSFELSANGGAVILVSTGTGQWWQM